MGVMKKGMLHKMSGLSLIARLVRQRTVRSIIRCRKRSFHNSACLYNKNEDEDDKPVKFSTSEAAGARFTTDFNKAPLETAPFYQGPVMLLSIAVLMIYLCFREENDLDVVLMSPEKDQLIKQILLRKKIGMPTDNLEKRLAEIETDWKDTLLELKQIKKENSK